MENNYKNLNKYEKLAEIQDLNLIKKERPYAAKYLKALWLNNTEVIAEYESFGNSARQLLMNRREYDQHLLFGFTDISFNQYGWLERPQFLNIEHFECPHRDGWAVSNHITIGRGINNKWSYGLSYSYSTGGGGYGLCVWGKIFDSRKECLITALGEITERLKKDASYTDRYVIKVLQQVKSLFNELTGRKVVQLSLF